jgi:hypothetical protein
MKITWGILAALLLVTGIVASLWWRQRETERTNQQRAVALQTQVQSLESELAQARATEPSKTVVVAPPTMAILPVVSSSPASNTPPPAPNPAMLQDPETRALMRKQQEQAFTKLADKIVSKEFAQQWSLTPEQTTQVKDLVREKALAGKDMLNAMLFDGLDDASLANRGRETKQRLADADNSLRTLLGPDGFDALKQQERMLEIRDRTKHIREEFAAAEQPLSESQQGALIEAMSAERQAFSFRVDYEDPAKFDFEHIRDVFSDANLQTYFEDLQQLNARVVERAALFLSPAQLEQLRNLQQNQVEQARLTTKMTTELFNRRRAN